MTLSTVAAHRKDLSGKPATMTHQHYREIASIIRRMPTFAPSLRTQRESCANAFADGLAGTNPNFNRERFLAACLSDAV